MPPRRIHEVQRFAGNHGRTQARTFRTGIVAEIYVNGATLGFLQALEVAVIERHETHVANTLELPDNAPHMSAAVLLVDLHVRKFVLEPRHHYTRAEIALTIPDA